MQGIVHVFKVMSFSLSDSFFFFLKKKLDDEDSWIDWVFRQVRWETS